MLWLWLWIFIFNFWLFEMSSVKGNGVFFRINIFFCKINGPCKNAILKRLCKISHAEILNEPYPISTLYHNNEAPLQQLLNLKCVCCIWSAIGKHLPVEIIIKSTFNMYNLQIFLSLFAVCRRMGHFLWLSVDISVWCGRRRPVSVWRVFGCKWAYTNRKRENEAVLRELMRIALKFVFLLHFKEKKRSI